jgi:hypothetical protein
MRKNTQEVWRAFRAGKACRKADSIWTDGVSIFSYRTCLLAPPELNGRYVFNDTRYSLTTTRHQHGLRMLMAEGWAHIPAFVEGMAFGATPADLVRRERGVA